MSAPTNTYQTYSQVNISEDLTNAIYNVDPFKTPLLNMAKKTKAEQTYHEWNEDSLAAQNTANAQIEGDDACRCADPHGSAWKLHADQPQDCANIGHLAVGRGRGGFQQDGLSALEEFEGPEARHGRHSHAQSGKGGRKLDCRS